MKPPLFDYKDIVKESLREAFYTKKVKSLLFEEIFGKKMKVRWFGETMDAVLSKNTKPGEEPYRVSWFSYTKTPQHLTAEGHIDISKEEVDYILDNKQFPPSVYKRIMISPTQLIIVNENLLLLEESSREIDLWLENKTIINESMTVSVKGMEYDRNMGDMNDVCNALLDNVLSPILRKLPQDQQDYFKKNGVPFYDTIVMDGDFYQSKRQDVGTINFYISGLIESTKQQVLNGILEYLKKLNIEWSTPKVEQSGVYKSQVIRIPVIKNPNKSERAPEMNLSNINSYQIFHNLLQYEGEHSFSMTAKDLVERIHTVLKHDPEWVKQHVINPTDSNWPKAERDDQEIENPHMDIMKQFGDEMGGARMMSGGLSEDRIFERLHQLLSLAQWALRNGHSEIVVG